MSLRVPLAAMAVAVVVCLGCSGSGRAGPSDLGGDSGDAGGGPAPADAAGRADLDDSPGPPDADAVGLGDLVPADGPGGPDLPDGGAPEDLDGAPDLVSVEDGGGPDGRDAGAGPDTGALPPRGGPPASLTSGGASVASESFRLTVTVGPPLPTGVVGSENYVLRLGPGAE